MKKRTKKTRVALSEQIRRAFIDAGQSLGEVSRATGIDKATLSRFRSGERGLPMKTLDRLADYLGWHLAIEAPTTPKRQTSGQHRT